MRVPRFSLVCLLILLVVIPLYAATAVDKADRRIIRTANEYITVEADAGVVSQSSSSDISRGVAVDSRGRVSGGAASQKNIGDVQKHGPPNLDQFYHECNSSALTEEMQLYTIGGQTGRRVDRTQCIRKTDLDFPAASSWLLLTMADKRFADHAYALVKSALAVPQNGGGPSRIVVVDGGMTEEQTARFKLLKVEIDDMREPLATFFQLGRMQHVPKELGYNGSSVGGVPFRAKAVATRNWFNKLKDIGVDQLVVLDAGGIILGSMHRVRNFAAAEGFYAGLTGISTLSALMADAGLAPEKIRRERMQVMREKGVLPSCFDYTKDFLVDETSEQVNISFTNRVGHLDTFEGGFLVFDSRHPWVQDFVQNFGATMENDDRWAFSQGYYFPHDQKILANEAWKAILCGKSAPAQLRLLDTNNIRFGNLAQSLTGQPHKGRLAFTPSEKVPWSGYAYHYCAAMSSSDPYVPHPCPDPKSYPMEAWTRWAQLSENWVVPPQILKS